MATWADSLTDNPELLVRTPRPARYTVATQLARLLLLILLIGGALTLWTYATRDINDLKALKAHGQQMLATITDKHEHHGKSSTYYLDYAFLVDRSYVASDEEVSLSEYNDRQIGSSLTVTYLPTNPVIHRVGTVTDERVSSQSTKWEIGILAFMAGMGLIFGFVEMQYRNHLALLRDGQPVVGKIIDRNMVRGKNTVYYIKYEFELSEQMVSRKVQVSRQLYEISNHGQTLTILYNPSNAKKNLPYAVLNDVILEDANPTRR